jgi:hypothetical protein
MRNTKENFPRFAEILATTTTVKTEKYTITFMLPPALLSKVALPCLQNSKNMHV